MKMKNVYLKPPLPFVPTTIKHSLIIYTLLETLVIVVSLYLKS